jgi:hypothetical protein
VECRESQRGAPSPAAAPQPARKGPARRLPREREASAASFNHLIRAGEDRGRDGKAERFGDNQVDDEIEFGRLLHRQIVSLDHLVGAGEEVRRNGQTECLSRRCIDDEFKRGGLLDRQLTRPSAAQDLIDVIGRPAE